MAIITENLDRRVIPNWRSYKETLDLGELGNTFNRNEELEYSSIKEYIEEWSKFKTIPFAADLLSAAIVRNAVDIPEVKSAAHFILENENNAPFSLIKSAKNILHLPQEKRFHSYKLSSLNEFLSDSTKQFIYHKIHKYKNRLADFPRNAILLVELARLYTLIGQKEQAKKALVQAINLAPNNRFVSRSSSRFFTEIDEDINYAIRLLRKNEFIKYDPWLLSAEIAIKSKTNKNSNLISTGKNLIEKSNFNLFETTELSSAIGTVELLDGSKRKSKKFFKQALSAPNDNSLAQVEWATNKDKSLTINEDLFTSTKSSHEANTLNSYFNHDWNKTIEYSLDWFFDTPNQLDPLLIGSRVTSVFQRDHATAAKFMEAGLISHPNEDLLLNNVAYYMAMDDRPVEAMKFLDRIKRSSEPSNATDLCALATFGLINYRLGNISVGRESYLRSIEIAEQNFKYRYLPLAILNFIREESRIGATIPELIITKIKNLPEEALDFEISYLKQDILSNIKDNDIIYNL